MKHLVFSILLSASFAHAVTLPQGGELVIAKDAIASMPKKSESKFGTRTLIPVSGQSFSQALQAELSVVPPQKWDEHIRFSTTCALNKQDVLFVRFFARGYAQKDESGLARVSLVIEQNGQPYTKELHQNVDLSREWKEYYVPIKLDNSYPEQGALTGFDLGHRIQTVEIAEFEVISFGAKVDIRSLPRMRVTYPGCEPNAPWRIEANKRIEQIRKGDLSVVVKGSTGKRLPNATVKVTQTRQAFGWGSAVTVKNILLEDAIGDQYRKIIADNFSRVVFENDLKWQSWDNPRHHADILKATQWLRDHNIEVRGHCLVWPSWRNTPRDLVTLKDDPVALHKRITEHITNEVATMCGKVVDWDVINEPYDNHDVMKILGNDEMIAWFKLARAHDPKANLYLNDYSILSAGGMDVKHQDHFEKTLRFLKDGGAPINGLGMQGHFGGSPTPPERMLNILGRFAKIGLSISVTEHDIDTEDEQFQADFTRDFLITTFSHPAVVGVLTWGFWEGSHWKPNGAYYRKDWSIKPAGQVWMDLVRKQWRTELEGKTDSTGAFKTRGFLGDYTITVTHNGKTTTQTSSLPATIEVCLP
jgi:GH35 family endo-1,4-beta-xylanase